MLGIRQVTFDSKKIQALLIRDISEISVKFYKTDAFMVVLIVLCCQLLQLTTQVQLNLLLKCSIGTGIFLKGDNVLPAYYG
jgi:hypothetical protein